VGPLATIGSRGASSPDPAFADRPPLALQPEDFASRAQRSAPSDLLSRMEAWAPGVAERLRAFGLDRLEATVREIAAGEFPCVRFAYAGGARGADADATSLVLGVDPEGVRAGLELPVAQARGARMRLADPARALELSTALEALPEQFMLSVSGRTETAQAQRATADDIRALLDEIERQPGSPSGSMWIGWSLPRAVALEHAALLDEQLEDALVVLAQVFALMVEDSSTSRDEPSAGRTRHAGRSEKGGHRAEYESDRGLAGARKDHGKSDKGQRAGHARPRGREREREGEPDRELEPVEAAAEVPTHRGRELDARLPPRAGLRGRFSKSSRVAVERGTRVRVLRGAFSGKVGVVHELDGKGNARVMLGLLAVRLDVKNLVPCGGGRPVLSSSHRKPIPDRS
jgi:hypothetical protein